MTNPIDQDPWWNNKGRMDENEPARPQDVFFLKTFLAGKIPVEEAATSLISTDTEIPELALDGKENAIAWLLFDAAIQFPSSQPDILYLVDAIAHIPADQQVAHHQQMICYPEQTKPRELGRFFEIVDEMRRSMSFILVPTSYHG